jgi:malate dehydrogenase (oxaloacetate-decarboxylating)
VPEIWPWEATEAGASIVGTGRSDFPNQVNNSLGFPAIFRSALDVRARTITDEMCMAAATEIAAVASDRGLREYYVIPTMEEETVFVREAVAVAMKAQEPGVARLARSRDDLTRTAEATMRDAKTTTRVLMEAGLIRRMPGEDT